MTTRKKQPGAVNHERWLVSYADFITLMFAFFVVMFASSQADKNKQAQVADAMKEAFAELGIFDHRATAPPVTMGAGATANDTALQLAEQATVAQLKQHLDRLIDDQVQRGHLPKDSVTTYIGRDGLVISLHEAGFFASGSAVVNPASLPLLSALVDTLPLRPVRVEGHTDDVPIHTTQYATNWELSTARASAIARFLLSRSKLDPKNVSAAGYAEFHPVAPNTTAEGRAQNRRVDIILLTGPALSR
jgi:chemotaxis protein MotB